MCKGDCEFVQNIPKRARWKAKDQNGDWYWFCDKPELQMPETGKWTVTSNPKNTSDCIFYYFGNICKENNCSHSIKDLDWQYSLTPLWCDNEQTIPLN
jgi:hypothetical protein